METKRWKGRPVGDNKEGGGRNSSVRPIIREQKKKKKPKEKKKKKKNKTCGQWVAKLPIITISHQSGSDDTEGEWDKDAGREKGMGGQQLGESQRRV